MAKKTQSFPVRTVNVPLLLQARYKIVAIANEYDRLNKDDEYFAKLDKIIAEVYDRGFTSCLNQWRRSDRSK